MYKKKRTAKSVKLSAVLTINITLQCQSLQDHYHQSRQKDKFCFGARLIKTDHFQIKAILTIAGLIAVGLGPLEKSLLDTVLFQYANATTARIASRLP